MRNVAELTPAPKNLRHHTSCGVGRTSSQPGSNPDGVQLGAHLVGADPPHPVQRTPRGDRSRRGVTILRRPTIQQFPQETLPAHPDQHPVPGAVEGFEGLQQRPVLRSAF